MSPTRPAPHRIPILVTLALVAAAGLAVAAETTARSPAAAIMAASGKVGPELVGALERDGAARVVVAFSLGRHDPPNLAGEDGRALVASVREDILSTLLPSEFALERRFRSVPAVGGIVHTSGVLRLIEHPMVRRIDLEMGGRALLAEAVPLVGLDRLRSVGLTGEGVTVAVIDSGLDTDHPDLADDLVAERCFCTAGGAGCCPDGSTGQTGPGSAEDDYGHGSHVAGVVTSSGALAPIGGAPDAEIVAVKVLESDGGFCCSADIVGALDWIINQQPSVDVVNMSLGTFALFPGDCDTATAYTMAWASAIDTLRANGVPTFAAAGNESSGSEMPAPACLSGTLSVGAVWDDDVGPQSSSGCFDPSTSADQVTCFSNSNSHTDLFAAGAPMVSAWLNGQTATVNGTSQASPLAAACAAVLLEAEPGLTPAQLESRLKSSPIGVVDATNGLRFPRVDCHFALDGLFADGFESGDQSGW